jgi:rare lipoprotein A
MASAALPHSRVLRHSVICLATAGLLMGCVEGGGTTSGTGGQTTAGPTAFRGASNREIEAPEVFQVTDSGLWDGRPSLGGIWVASPDVIDPERVVILNPATGKSVNGALFRRERENPGPRLQVSSDAAEALGMLAGQPTDLRVTALRRATDAAPAAAVEATAAPEAVTAEDATNAAAGNSAAAETAALATAALAAAGAAAGAATDAAPDAAAAVDGSVEAAATEPAKPKTWKERRAEAKARRDAEKAAKAAAAAAVAAAEVDGEAAATVDTAAVAAVETAPLDARVAEGAADAGTAAGTEAVPAAAPEKKKTRKEIREEQAAAEAAAAEAAAAAATATETPAPAVAKGRSIQIASFSKEDNASRAVDALAKIGITAQVKRSEQSGIVVWGVVTAGDDATLASIKDAGFADAFFVN